MFMIVKGQITIEYIVMGTIRVTKWCGVICVVVDIGYTTTSIAVTCRYKLDISNSIIAILLSYYISWKIWQRLVVWQIDRPTT